MKNFYLFLLVSSTLVLPSHGTLISSDSFANTAGGADYNTGNLAGQSATVGTFGYTGNWSGGTAAMQIANGGLSHALTPGNVLDGQIVAFTGTGTAERKLFRPINYTPTDGTYYFSSLFRKTIATSQRDMVAGLGPLEGATSGYGSSQATFMGIWNGGFQFSSGGGIFTELLTPAQLTLNETFLGQMEINYSTTGADSIRVSVYDGSSALVADQLFTSLDLDGDISHIGLGTRDYSPNVGVDEIRFGTSLTDVRIIPEPSSTAIFLLVGLRFLFARRRRSLA